MIHEHVLTLIPGMIWNDRQSYKEDKTHLYTAGMIGDYNLSSGVSMIYLIIIIKIFPNHQ